MNKFLTKIAGLFLGMAMAIGVGVAVGSNAGKASVARAEDKILTFDLTSNPGGWPTTASSTETAYNYTLNNVTYEFTLKNIKQNSGYLMMNYVAALGLPKLSSGKLTKVVAHNSGGCSTSTRVGISSSASSASYITGGAYQTYSTTNKDYTYNLSGTSDNTRYYIYVTNKNCQLTSLELTYSGDFAPATDDAEVSIKTPDLSKLPAGYVASTKLEASPSNFGGTVTYSWGATENGDYVTLTQDPSDGSKCTVTSKGTNSTGDVTIKVTATDNTDTAEDTFVVSLVSVNTVTQSIAAIDAGSGIEGVFTKGLVNGYFKSGTGYTPNISEASAIDGNGRAKFFISGDGTEGTNKTRIEIYNCYDVNGAQFSTLPALGTELVVYGNLSLYQSTTYQVNADGFLVHKETPTVSSIAKTSDLTKDEYTVGDKFSLDGLVITATLSNGSTMDVTSLCEYSPDDEEELTGELTELMISYSASNNPTTTSGSDIDITITISVTYPSADATIALIDDIGTVEYTQASYDKIAAARASYDALPAQSQTNVSNYSTLTDAESDFDALVLSAVDNVETLITNIGTVTLSSGTAISTAETAYEALLAGDLGKSLVSNYSTLTTARSTYDALVAEQTAVEDTIALIDDIGTVEYTQASYDKIAAARASYDALPAQSQTNVSNYSTLTDAESDFDALVLSAVDNVETLITNIGTVTLSSGTAISTAETAYEALLAGDLGKSLVSNYSTLTTARSTYDALVVDRAAADVVEGLIDGLPDASSISDYSHHDDIAAARAAYTALSESQKEMVNSEKLQKLVDCETADEQYKPLSVEMKFTGTSNYTTSDKEDAAGRFNLNTTDWSAICYKQSASAVAGNSTDHEIRLYYNASGSNYVVVSAKESSWTIDSIVVTCTTNYSNFAVYAGSSISGSPVTLNDGAYAIDNQSFAITNANTSNVQVRIKSIVINYSVEQAATADDFLDAVEAIPTISNITSSNLDEVNSLITVAENEYSKLTPALKEDADVIAAKATLDSAKEKAVDVGYEVEAAATIAAIEALPEAADISDYSHHADIVNARASYDALSDNAKAKVSNYSKLVACEEAELPFTPATFTIDVDGGAAHDKTNSTAGSNCNTATALEGAYPIGTTIANWKGGSTAYSGSSHPMKLGSGSSTGSVTLSFAHDRHYATSVTLEAYSWSGKEITLSVNGVTHKLSGYTAALEFDLTGVDFSNDVVISTTSDSSEERVTLYTITVAYAYRADYQIALTFENSYVKKNIDYPETTPTGVSGTDCLSTEKGGEGYFDAAMDYYNSNLMGAEARLEFATHDDFANARERLQAWARANGKTLTFNTTTGAATIGSTRINSFLLIDEQNHNNEVILIIALISIITVTCAGGYFFLRRRKED